MLKRAIMLAAAVCALALTGCVSAPAVRHPDYAPPQQGARAEAAQGSFNLNGTAYRVTLTINGGKPVEGSLAREDASSGWRLTLAGAREETVMLAGAQVERDWELSLDLAKQGLTANPNGLYKGKAFVSLVYDMQSFDKAAFGLVQELRGEGEDFDYRYIKGWRSHDAYEPSVLTQRWQSEDFVLYIGGLKENGEGYAKTLGHTLSDMWQTAQLSLAHRLMYDLPAKAETFVYALESDAMNERAELSLVQYSGKNRKELPLEPLDYLDFSSAFNALEENVILLEFTAAQA